MTTIYNEFERIAFSRMSLACKDGDGVSASVKI